MRRLIFISWDTTSNGFLSTSYLCGYFLVEYHWNITSVSKMWSNCSSSDVELEKRKWRWKIGEETQPLEEREREKKKCRKTIIALELTDVLICITRNRAHSFFFLLLFFFHLFFSCSQVFPPPLSPFFSLFLWEETREEKKPPNTRRYINVFFSHRQNG